MLAERAKVIAENAKKGDLPGAQSAQFLSMLESLFEKEAKRMEIDMKAACRKPLKPLKPLKSTSKKPFKKPLKEKALAKQDGPSRFLKGDPPCQGQLRQHSSLVKAAVQLISDSHS